jgi:RHS repeat-associated protein
MVYDGDNIALTFDGNGTQTHRYLYGPRVDEILADETLTGVNWALTDNQGTVRDVIDSNGVVLNHLTYDSYGQVTSETNPNVNFRYGYTGRERDEETGLDYYRTRYYDSLVGRFVSEDTIGFNGGDTNLYRYVANSPIRFTDPNGTDLYDVVNGVDQAVGGFASGATGGATDIIREKIYGRSVNDNQQGLLHDGASVLGDAASSVVGGAAAKGGSRLVRAGAGLLRNANKAADTYRKGESAYDIARGCGDLEDLRNLASGWGGNGKQNKQGNGQSASPASGIIGNNQVQGKLGEEEVLRRLQRNPNVEVVGTQMKVKTPQNPDHRDMDILIKDKNGDLLHIEVKTGNATRNTSQVAKDTEIAQGQGTTFYGRNARAAGFPNGTPTGPIPTIVSRPN